MITQLSKKDEAALFEYRDKWLAIGLSCAPLDFERAKAAAIAAYRQAGLPEPKLWLRVSSPYASVIAATFVKCGQGVGVPVWRQVWEQVHKQVAEQVEGKVAEQVREQVRGQVREQVEEQMWEVREQVEAQVREQVEAQVWADTSAFKDASSRHIDAQCYGSHDAAWLAYYDFFSRMLPVCEQLRPLMDLAECCGWWAPYAGLCILQDRHCELHRNGRHQLHRDGGPAVLYSDGWSVYALNGVRMERHWVETPAEQLDPIAVVKEGNVEVRRELIRKIGIERLLGHLPHQVLDTRGNYELLNVTLSNAVSGNYLKMLNPSIGVWHMEGVPNDCETVQHAINWRAGNLHEDWQPEILT